MFLAKVFSNAPVPSKLIKLGFSGVFCLDIGRYSGKFELRMKITFKYKIKLSIKIMYVHRQKVIYEQIYLYAYAC